MSRCVHGTDRQPYCSACIGRIRASGDILERATLERTLSQVESDVTAELRGELATLRAEVAQLRTAKHTPAPGAAPIDVRVDENVPPGEIHFRSLTTGKTQAMIRGIGEVVAQKVDEGQAVKIVEADGAILIVPVSLSEAAGIVAPKPRCRAGCGAEVSMGHAGRPRICGDCRGLLERMPLPMLTAVAGLGEADLVGVMEWLRTPLTQLAPRYGVPEWLATSAVPVSRLSDAASGKLGRLAQNLHAETMRQLLGGDPVQRLADTFSMPPSPPKAIKFLGVDLARDRDDYFAAEVRMHVERAMHEANRFSKHSLEEALSHAMRNYGVHDVHLCEERGRRAPGTVTALLRLNPEGIRTSFGQLQGHDHAVSVIPHAIEAARLIMPAGVALEFATTTSMGCGLCRKGMHVQPGDIVVARGLLGVCESVQASVGYDVYSELGTLDKVRVPRSEDFYYTVRLYQDGDNKPKSFESRHVQRLADHLVAEGHVTACHVHEGMAPDDASRPGVYIVACPSPGYNQAAERSIQHAMRGFQRDTDLYWHVTFAPPNTPVPGCCGRVEWDIEVQTYQAPMVSQAFERQYIGRGMRGGALLERVGLWPSPPKKLAPPLHPPCTSHIRGKSIDRIEYDDPLDGPPEIGACHPSPACSACGHKTTCPNREVTP